MCLDADAMRKPVLVSAASRVVWLLALVCLESACGSAQTVSFSGPTPRVTPTPDASDAPATALERQGDYAGALSLRERALVDASKHGAESREVMTAAIPLASLELVRGDYAGASIVAAKAVNIGVRVLGRESPDLAEHLLLWGRVLAATGRCGMTPVFFDDAQTKLHQVKRVVGRKQGCGLTQP